MKWLTTPTDFIYSIDFHPSNPSVMVLCVHSPEIGEESKRWHAVLDEDIKQHGIPYIVNLFEFLKETYIKCLPVYEVFEPIPDESDFQLKHYQVKITEHSNGITLDVLDFAIPDSMTKDINDGRDN